MTEIETANKTNLAHNTYRHIKVTLSAMFTFAKRKGIFDGVNPMCGVSIPKGRKHGRKRLAYSPLEVEAQLQAFDDEPTVLAIVGTAALAGLPESLVLYCARHTFGTAAYGATGNLAMVMNVMGHTDIRTAMRYQHPVLDSVREAIDQRNIRHKPRHNELRVQ